ncbi:MAG: cobyric acid synthase [[Eubacterium] sulci]|nr:cobyric acid synthase [[Eubacterium] sulci]
MGKAKCIMVQGTMSGAGKSLLCAALCRIFKQDGYKVAPFKSQNMALNSYVTRNGMEMGRAQVMQAEAAGIEPDVRMNPVLLKPSSDIGSQVIVLGEVRGQMTATEYYEYKNSLMPEVMKAYNELAEENDIIVIEGAGSPAEINLRENDIVNMGMAEAAGAPVLLAGDIDRGGVFAQLYGTVKLLTDDEQKRIAGLIVNKFRGDIDILAPGLKMVEEKTGIPVLGVIPYIRVDIDDEDSLAPRLNAKSEVKPLDIAIIRIPRMSNFTDFAPLEAHEVIGARYVQSAEELHNPDMVIIPGTKSTMDDLLWMRQNGIESAIQKLASSGTPVLGVCGGYQMMGEKLQDPHHIEGDLEEMHGMGLLPTETTFTQIKTSTRFTADVKAKDFEGAKLDGYEIHMGESIVKGDPFLTLENGKDDGCACGTNFGTYLHGLFDTGELTEKLVKYLCDRKGIEYSEAAPISHSAYVEKQYDILADGVRAAMDFDKIYKIMGLR